MSMKRNQLTKFLFAVLFTLLFSYSLTRCLFAIPEQITSLTASSGSDVGSVVVQWVEPSFSVSVNTQDLRWNTVPIDETNWAASTPLSPAPFADLPGTLKSYPVNNLTPGVLYYFAVKSQDGFTFEWSSHSNVAVASARQDDIVPAAVTTLTLSPLAGGQGVKLQWLAPGDDGTVGTVTGYQIKYSLSDIYTPALWTSAAGVSASDIDYWNYDNSTPSFSSSGQIQKAYIYDLPAGSDIYFAVKAIDNAGNYSDISNSTVTYISAGTSGEGTASILPVSASANAQITSTITFTVGANPVGPGGEIAVSIPPGWTAPTVNIGMSGYVSFSTISGWGAGTLTIETTGQWVIISPSSQSDSKLNPGDQIFICYQNGWTSSSLGNTTVYTASKSNKSLTRSWVSSQPVIELQAGSPSWVYFENMGLTVKKDTASSLLKLLVKDNNWNTTSATATVTITLAGKVYNPATYMYDVDATAQFSATSDFASTISSVDITTGAASAGFYYKTSAAGNTMIEASYNLTGYTQFTSLWTTVVTGDITNSKIHTGNYAANKTVTITPDNDGIDDRAYIDFSITDSNVNWQVLIATSSDFTLPKWTYWGYGIPLSGQVSWDGSFSYYDPATYYWKYEKAPNGTYFVRIQYTGGAIVDNTLSVTVNTLEISGNIKDATSSLPISDVYVYAYGPSYSNGMTDAAGNYKLAGLKAGSYNLSFSKPGYSYKTVSGVSAGATNANYSLDRPGYIKINARRGVSDSIIDPENWGSANLWSASGVYNSYYGSLHFAVDVSTSDNGGWVSSGNAYETENTTGTYQGGKWTIIEASPGTYNFRADLYGYGSVEKTGITIAAGQTTEITDIIFARKKSIQGTVVLPEAVTDSWGSYVSIEALPSGYTYGTAWGWCQIPLGQSSATYVIYGIDAGGWTLRTFAPGYARGTVSVTVGAADEVVTAPNITLTTGGTITGTITVEGDTTGADLSSYFSMDPYYVYLNAWSPSNYSYGWTQLQIAKNTTIASNTFSIKGLDDGTYWLNSWLYGFDLEGAVGWSGVRATVSGGVCSINLKFKRYSGRLTTKFIVPGNDYANLQISINGPNMWAENRSTAAIVGMGASFDEATGVLTTPPLGTGFYRIKGLYTGSALEKTKSAMAVNGESRDAGTIDLTATTYSISGRVKINPINPVAQPYDDVSFIVSTAPVHNTISPPPTYISTTSFRVSAYEYKNYKSLSGTSGGSDTNKNGMIQQDGSYQINGLTPGVYVLKIPALNIDGDYDNGYEIQTHEKQVMVTGNVSNCDMELSNGYSVKGRLKLPDGSAAVTRDFNIYVFDAAKYGYGSWTAYVGYVTCAFNNATSADYEIKHLLPGDYIVSVQDYGYWDNALSQWFPQQYANTALKVEIEASDLNGQDLQLSKGGTVKYKLKDANSGTVITPANKSKMLPSSYGMYAVANPWVEGGYGSLATVSGTANQTDYFEMKYLPKATYDLHLGQSEYGLMGFSSISGGADMGGNNASYAAKTVNSIKVENNQTTDIGTIEIKQGLSISGTVTDSSGKGIPNVPVVAAASLTNDFSSELRGFTDINGKYTILGLDSGITYYDIIACPRIDMSDFGGYFFFGSGGLAFGEKVKSMVKIAAAGPVDFVLLPALGSVKGTVVTADGNTFQNPDDLDYPTAKVFMQPADSFPRTNPIGDITVDTNIDGTFTVEAISSGTYKLVVLSGGYASYSAEITVGNGELNLGAITLKVGAKISGTITKLDGKNPASSEVRSLVAANDDFTELLVGSLKYAGSDAAAKTVVGYSMAGFQPDVSYNIMFADESDELLPAVVGFTVGYASYTNTDYNLTYQPTAPSVFSRARKEGGVFTIYFDLTGALRNSIPSDNDLTQIITLTSGAGTLSDRYISPNRKILTCKYTAPAGENKFTLKINGYGKTVNPETGTEFTVIESFEYYAGIGAKNRVRISNLKGGKITLEGDDSSLFFRAGAFRTASSTVSVSVDFTRAEDKDTFSASAPHFGVSKFLIPKAPAAYSGLTFKAMDALKATGMSPFSSFYEIMLPAGVSRTLRKDARLSLQYSTSTATDPTLLNVYYYDTTNNVYLLEKSSKTVNTENNTITVSISHTSVFVLLKSDRQTITGSAYGGTELMVYNFPNPFNLTSKTKTLANGGVSSLTTKGTVLKYGIPSTYESQNRVKITIYNIVGEVLREIDEGVKSAGYYYYTEWNGENDYDKEVASGVYIGKLEVGKHKPKFFKMAVIK